jgi:biopolymer transport protein TolR
MLVLLIIFMVTAPLLTQGIKVELPKAGAEPIADSSSLTPLILSVDAQGNLFINVGDDEDKPQDSKSIISRTRALLNSQPTTMVLVKADRSVPYGNVVGAMVLLQQGGAKDIGFVTDPLETYPVPE